MEKCHCMWGFGGREVETMTWNRDKSSWEGKATNGEILSHVGLKGGKFKQ
jgi:hypothetical protein